MVTVILQAMILKKNLIFNMKKPTLTKEECTTLANLIDMELEVIASGFFGGQTERVANLNSIKEKLLCMNT